MSIELLGLVVVVVVALAREVNIALDRRARKAGELRTRAEDKSAL